MIWTFLPVLIYNALKASRQPKHGDNSKGGQFRQIRWLPVSEYNKYRKKKIHLTKLLTTEKSIVQPDWSLHDS